MKKLCFLLLFLLVLLGLCSTAFAAGIPGQQSIAYITDENGYVTTLTDDQTTTAWTKSGNGGVDLTINMYNGTVGEIWIRNGYAYTQSWYNNYDRASKVKVTVYYSANQYTDSYDTYRYTLSDTYRPTAMSNSWNSGYQRLLLPKQYKGVTKIEVTIESAISGYGRTGATISDIIVASGSHSTATPKAYATATPKPYVVYVTPTPGPEIKEDEPLVEFITPRPTQTPVVTIVTPKPTATPLVELITPTPVVQLITPTPEPVDYPSKVGVIGYANQRIPTRSGPGNAFDEPGSFFSAGHQVKVISKSWEENNHLYWYQIEFKDDGEWYRAYTTDYRIDVDADAVPTEPQRGDPLDSRTILEKCKARFGPGQEYAEFSPSTLHPGNKVDVYAIEDGWAQIEYTDYGSYADPQPKRRGWVPLEMIYEQN